MINASLKRGLATINPRLIRFAVGLWWHDCTARDLGQGYRGLTVPVSESPSINTVFPSSLHPGDLAVTMSGVHILAYLGDNHWIEADPTAHKVLIVQVPESNNAWFNVPVRIVRWRTLSNAAP
jgi:hypothetical protein